MFTIDYESYLSNKKARIPCICDNAIINFDEKECDIGRKFVLFKGMVK